MLLLDQLAESRIREALQAGEFDNLPGAGQPLPLDDNSHVPPELRVAYRVLKNANYLPPGLEQRREIRDVEDLLRHAQDTGEARQASQRLNYLRMQLSLARGDRVDLRADEAYYQQVRARLAGP